MAVTREEKEGRVSFEDDARTIENSEEFVEEQASKTKDDNGEDEESPFGEDLGVVAKDDDDEKTEETEEEKSRTVITPKRPPGRPRKEDQRLVISVESNKDKKQQTEEEVDKLHIRKANARELDEIVARFDYSKSGKNYIGLHRVEPRTYKGKKLSGYLGKCEEKIDYEWIKNMHGGGTFDVFIHGEKNGESVIRAKRRIEISGEPVLENIVGYSGDEEKAERSKDVIEKTLIMSEKNVDRFQKQADEARREKDQVMAKLIEVSSAPRNDNSGKEHIGLVKEFMDSTLKLTQEQLRRSEDNEKLANERYLEAQKSFREEVKSLKQEMTEKSTRELNPLLAMIQTDRKETSDKFAMLMSENKNSTEMMMKMVMENNRIQQENRDKFFEMQMKLASDSAKYKDDITTKRMEEILTDLREAKKAGNTDILSEIKKFKLLKEVIGGGDAAETEKESIVDKIFNNIDQAPAILGALGGLFSKGQPVVVSATPSLPPGAMMSGQSTTQQEQEQVEEGGEEEAQEQPTAQSVAPASEEQRLNMKVQMAASRLMKDVEEAISTGADPIEFVHAKVFGKYEDEVLMRISMVPVKTIIAGIEQQLAQIGGDSILMTAGGQDFLTKMHKAMHQKYHQ